MRGLITYFVVACSFLATGANIAADTVSLVTKSFRYDNKDIIFALQPFAKNELVYAVCKGSGARRKCKLYMETDTEETSTIQSCDVRMEYGDEIFYHYIHLVNAGNSRAVFVQIDTKEKYRLVSVNMKDCDIKVANIELRKRPNRSGATAEDIHIVPHEKDYDVIYSDQEICNDNFCKATFGYDGQLVKAASSFPVKDIDGPRFIIASSNGSYLVFVPFYVRDYGKVFLIDKDENSSLLFNGSSTHPGLSTEENAFGFCAFSGKEKEVCRQYDSDGKTKKFEVEVETWKGYKDAISVLNLENGLLVLNVVTVEDKKKSFLVRFDEQGKQQRYIDLDVKCEHSKVLVARLYKSSSGKYCVTSMCLTSYDSRTDHDNFTRNSRCFSHSELF